MEAKNYERRVEDIIDGEVFAAITTPYTAKGYDFMLNPKIQTDDAGRCFVEIEVPFRTYDVIADRRVVTELSDKLSDLDGMSGDTSISELPSGRKYIVRVYLG